MYDLPSLTAATDQLWADIRDALRIEGIDAPEALTRQDDLDAVWTDPALVLSQTCGLPLVTGRAGDATVLGAFDFGLEGCAPGQYNSIIIVPETSSVTCVDDLEDARFAYNETGSQSGYAALKRHCAERLGTGIATGAHLASVEAVASGKAEVAAIDAVTWSLATDVLPAARRNTRQIAATSPTPGLPLITAPGRDPAPFRRALVHAARRPNPFGIQGFVPLDRAAYAAAIFPVD